jgi:hypothetical protein
MGRTIGERVRVHQIDFVELDLADRLVLHRHPSYGATVAVSGGSWVCFGRARK